MPKLEGRKTNKPAPVDLSKYLVEQFLMPNADGGVCAAGCGRTIVWMSRCSSLDRLVSEWNGLVCPDCRACALICDASGCGQRHRRGWRVRFESVLSPVCAHCTLVVETGRPCCLADLPLTGFVQSIYGEDACNLPPGHAGAHQNRRMDTWNEDGTPL